MCFEKIPVAPANATPLRAWRLETYCTDLVRIIVASKLKLNVSRGVYIVWTKTGPSPKWPSRDIRVGSSSPANNILRSVEAVRGVWT
jgi:hypothetical protein